MPTLGTIKAGSTSVRIPILLRKTSDSTETTGVASGSVTASYQRAGGTRTAITVSALGSVGAAYSSGGWIEVDATNMPGLYRFDIPDAAFAAGVDWVVVSVKVTNSFTFYERFDLATNTPTDVYTELTGSISELAQAAPTATPTIKTALMWLYMICRNKLTATNTSLKVHNDAGTVIAKSTIADDGTTASRDEFVAGP